MDDDKLDLLSKHDLMILMDSYKNNIQLNTTLLEQQKQLMVINDQLMEKQTNLCTSVDKLVDKLTICSKTISDNQIKLSDDIILVNKGFEVLTKSNIRNTEDLSNLSTNIELKHSSLINRFYVSFVGMTTIVLAVVALAISYSDKIHSLSILVKGVIPGG